MKRIVFRIWFCLWPLFLGMLLPLFALPGGVRLFNYFWEFVCGLGFWAIDKTAGLRIQSPYLILGVLVWPAVLCAAMFFAASALQKMERPLVRRIAIAALLLSSLLVIRMDDWHRLPWSKIPTYAGQFFVVW